VYAFGELPPEADTRAWRVLLVEDDEDFVQALSLVVDARIALTHARSVGEARCLAGRGQFEAACVDLELPDGDGVDVIRALLAADPELPIVVLTVHRSDARILGAFRAGARGYLLKEHTGTRLVPALAEAMEGGAPMSPAVARRLLEVVAALPAPTGPSAEPPRLTDREGEVLRAFATGLTYAQAAASLGISVNTLRSHVRSAYEKLAVGTRTEAVMSALQLGLLSRS
jgi:DNA-binding NarL/FixJ family response regulator